MWTLAVREDDYPTADSLMRRKFAADKVPLGHRAMLAIVRRDSAAHEHMLGEATKQASGHPFAPEWIALYLNDFARAAEFAQAALGSPRSSAVRDSVHQFLALLALAEGRWGAAKVEFALAERGIPSAKRLRALAASWRFIPVPTAELVALRAELSQWDPSADAPESTPDLASALHPQLRLYLLGLLSSRLGDDAEALRHVADLERMDRPPEAAKLVRDLTQTVQADVALRRGRPADALKLLEPVRGEGPLELLARPFYSEEISRYLRAEALYQLGRDEEALRWLRNGFQETPLELVLLAPAHFRQAELYERLGDRKQAADHYSRFIQLWRRCDPELRPSVDKAKARLASLMGEPRAGPHPE
jgi:tetratricopeptide (TPR) repeat protein